MISLVSPDQRGCRIGKLGETRRVLENDVAPKKRFSSLTRDQCLELAEKIEVNGGFTFSLATAPAKAQTEFPRLVAADVDEMAIEEWQVFTIQRSDEIQTFLGGF